MRHFVYVTENTENGMQYIGSYSAEKARKNYFGSGRKFKKILTEIGKDSFSKQECEVESFEKKQELELFMMEVCDCMWPNGYNRHMVSSRGVFGMSGDKSWMTGKKRTEESRRKQGESTRGEKNHNFGKSMTEEQKQKIGRANTGKIRDDDFKERVSKTLTGIVRPIITCSHCGLSGGNNGMKRYHFDNCKDKE